MKVFIATALSLVICATGAAFAADNKFNISGTQIVHDDVTNTVEVSAPRISTAGGRSITAKNAKFALPDGNQSAHVIELAGAVTISDDSTKITAPDGANYYPELDTVSARSISLISPYTTTSYTCNNGQLSANGVPTGGKSVCVGSGYIITCSGNQVVMYDSQQLCD